MKLSNIYLYDLIDIDKFDFIANIDYKPRQKNSAESIFHYKSCIYVGELLQNLGRSAEAEQAYNIAIKHKSDISKVCKLAEFRKLELKFISATEKNLLFKKNVQL